MSVATISSTKGVVDAGVAIILALPHLRLPMLSGILKTPDDPAAIAQQLPLLVHQVRRMRVRMWV
jgi:hypothetical protein